MMEEDQATEVPKEQTSKTQEEARKEMLLEVSQTQQLGSSAKAGRPCVSGLGKKRPPSLLTSPCRKQKLCGPDYNWLFSRSRRIKSLGPLRISNSPKTIDCRRPLPTLQSSPLLRAHLRPYEAVVVGDHIKVPLRPSQGLPWHVLEQPWTQNLGTPQSSPCQVCQCRILRQLRFQHDGTRRM